MAFSIMARIVMAHAIMAHIIMAILRCCTEPMQLNFPSTMMPSRVHSASHSSIECDVSTMQRPARRSSRTTSQRNLRAERGSIHSADLFIARIYLWRRLGACPAATAEGPDRIGGWRRKGLGETRLLASLRMDTRPVIVVWAACNSGVGCL